MSTQTTAAPAISPATVEVLATTIAGAVQRQLTDYVATMSQQVEVARQAAEQAKADIRAEFNAQLQSVIERLDINQQQHDGYQRSLQTALETRLAEFAQYQQRRISDVEDRILQIPTSTSTVDASDLAALREQLDGHSAAAHARIDDLQKASHRFDQQASALVQHVNDTTVALSQRMDEGNRTLAQAVEERLGLVRSSLESIVPEVQRQIGEHTAMVNQRVDFVDNKVTDRMLAMEERINENTGTKLAQLEASMGRIGSGFDDAIGALSQRMLELENRLYEHNDRLVALAEQVSKVDEQALDAVKEQLSSAVGEAMLVRIELDRMAADTDEKFDKNTLRMAEIEAQLSDTMDVSAAVQLERLEELERAIIELDPSQFVRTTDPTLSAGRPSATESSPSF
jgi:hypothetical protein